ncbi:MAG: NUDIX domain-containing protein [Acidobacteriota bacterium]|nr:NUDIX domain-containing protein [Acidobacteriota bacterium]
MLQQTTVAAVLPRYASFLDRFPDIDALARAKEESVLAEWSGLGYYARARHLSRAARQVVRDHGGELPRDIAALRALPGFGEYTAAAVASLAWNVRAPAADANVTRILSRVHGIQGTAGSPGHRQRVLAAAAEILPLARPGDATAALMDLGQAICLPRRPRCPRCPLRAECAGFASGDPEQYPRRPEKPPMVRASVAAGVARREGRALLVRRPGEASLGGLWEFPSAQAESLPAAREGLTLLLRSLGLTLDEATPPAPADHTIMRRRLEIAVFRAVPAPPGAGNVHRRRARWWTPGELDRAAVSTLTRKIGRAAGFLPVAQ